MPSLGADMDEGTLVEWLVAPGARVQRGDIVAVVDTEKADVEIECFDSGTIDEILVPAGAKVPVGTPLASIRSEGEPPAQVVAPARSEPAAKPAAPARVAAPAPPRVQSGESRRVRATPLARRIAHERGLDLERVSGTGPDGAITRADLETAEARGPAPSPREPTPPARAPRPLPRVADALATAEAPKTRPERMRRVIATAMERSKREIPHYYLATTVDMSRALAWLQLENQQRSVSERLLAAPLLLRAAARAAREMPEFNGTWRDGSFTAAERVHLGVAISIRGGGLIAPALHDVDRKSVDEVMQGLRDLVTRVRAGRLRSSELSDPTLTVTSLGERGVETVYGVIYPPQVAIVGFGTIAERPWAENGLVGARPTLSATLAADHRVSDGVRGARFLARIARLLGAPEEL